MIAGLISIVIVTGATLIGGSVKGFFEALVPYL